MADITTEEGREKLRREYLGGYEAWGANPDQSVMLRALDGLDIAQERLIKSLKKILLFYLNCGSLEEAKDFDWVDWAEDAEDAFAEWNKWKA